MRFHRAQTFLLLALLLSAVGFCGEPGAVDIANPLTDPKDLEAPNKADITIKGERVAIPAINKGAVDLLFKQFAQELEGAELVWVPNALTIKKNVRKVPASEQAQPAGLGKKAAIPYEFPAEDGILITLMYDRCRYAGCAKLPNMFNKPYGTAYMNAFNAPAKTECAYFVVGCGSKTEPLRDKMRDALNAYYASCGWTQSDR